MTAYPFAADAPVHVAKVGLKARDADMLVDYYKNILGLAELKRSADRIVLGVAGDGLGLLDIERAPSLKPDDPREAGLFHTAFLLPTRADLARWVKRAIDERITLDGASDHLVSEALYLSDPEGNGIEIYADRPKDAWRREGSQIAMATERLDIDGLLAEPGALERDWSGAPVGTIVGHVHLRVGDPREAEAWWQGEMGFDTMAKYGSQAVFLSTGGYHHHIGANSWRSAGAGKRDTERAGLSFVELTAHDGKAKTITDPWGTEIRVEAKG
ncbi:MAG: VOC family protein [Rhizobiaceae bacterium]|nr:VOC family protein [Rhizobiaceae bacterium]MCV0408859.1 VOC family protein [Rhizobiaceae bacterium]